MIFRLFLDFHISQNVNRNFVLVYFVSSGLDEVEALKQENEALKRRLMKTRRALEDTFQHLSASNKNKKNVEKAITKQLMMTKSILKKTRTYEEPFD